MEDIFFLPRTLFTKRGECVALTYPITTNPFFASGRIGPITVEFFSTVCLSVCLLVHTGVRVQRLVHDGKSWSATLVSRLDASLVHGFCVVTNSAIVRGRGPVIAPGFPVPPPWLVPHSANTHATFADCSVVPSLPLFAKGPVSKGGPIHSLHSLVPSMVAKEKGVARQHRLKGAWLRYSLGVSPTPKTVASLRGWMFAQPVFLCCRSAATVGIASSLCGTDSQKGQYPRLH